MKMDLKIFINVSYCVCRYQEKDILVMQVKSPVHLSKVIGYRKRDITGKLHAFCTCC